MTPFARKRAALRFAPLQPKQEPELALGSMADRIWPELPNHKASWIRAVRWMRSRPGGSIWILDMNARAPSWRADPTEAA